MSISPNPMPESCRVDPGERTSILRPYVLGHGTLECYDLKASRKFYEEFLGLECVHHAISALAVRLGMAFHIVCVEVGDQIHPCHMLNHWGLDVTSREEVEQAHAKALEYKDKYGIRQVMDVMEMHGVYSFYMEDLDHNWWEIQYYENGFQHEDYFDFGDRFTTSKDAEAS